MHLKYKNNKIIPQSGRLTIIACCESHVGIHNMIIACCEMKIPASLDPSELFAATYGMQCRPRKLGYNFDKAHLLAEQENQIQ